MSAILAAILVAVIKSDSAAQVLKHVRPLLFCVGPYNNMTG